MRYKAIMIKRLETFISHNKNVAGRTFVTHNNRAGGTWNSEFRKALLLILLCPFYIVLLYVVTLMSTPLGES